MLENMLPLSTFVTRAVWTAAFGSMNGIECNICGRFFRSRGELSVSGGAVPYRPDVHHETIIVERKSG